MFYHSVAHSHLRTPFTGWPRVPQVSLPVPKLRVPRSCGFCKGGYDAADIMGFAMPAACIAPTAYIICTVSPGPVIDACPFCTGRAAATAYFRFSNRGLAHLCAATTWAAPCFAMFEDGHHGRWDQSAFLLSPSGLRSLFS